VHYSPGAAYPIWPAHFTWPQKIAHVYEMMPLPRLVVAFFLVVLLLLLALPLVVVVFAFARAVVFFVVVELRREIVGFADAESAPGSTVVAFLRVVRRVVVPFCSGFSSALRCTATTSV